MSCALKVDQLKKVYFTKGEAFTALDNVSFSAEKGEILGILGPNGSGKTTTLKSICGLTTVDEGDITISGKNSLSHRTECMFNLGVVLEGARNIYWRLSAKENMVYFAGIKGMSTDKAQQHASQIIEKLDLEQYQDQEVRKLSKGNQQKVAIACAIIHKPELILLDEPTLGLDVEIVRVMKQWLQEIAKENKACILITSHDMDFIEEVCDRVVILFKGRIISESSVADLRKKFSPQKSITLVVENTLDESTKSKLLELCDWKISEQNQSTQVFMRSPSLHLLAPSLQILEEGNYLLQDIQVEQDSLEDIFLDVIKVEDKA